MLSKKKLIILGLILILLNKLFANDELSISMDYKDQKITDIIYSLAEICDKSVIIDETVTGNASFCFEELNFEKALNRLCDNYHLFVEKDDDIFYISKLNIKIDKELISINTENVDIELFLNILSRKTKSTIMYDALPKSLVTIRVQNVELEDILNLVLVKLPGFGLERISSGFYLSKTAGSINSRRNIDIFTISLVENNYTLNIQSANFSTVIDSLFKKEKKEYSFFGDSRKQINNFKITNKDFSTTLRLLLEQAFCDFAVNENGLYYIFDIQQQDVLKKFRTTEIVPLIHINTNSLLSILPQDLNANNFIKVDTNTNSIILTGSNSEITPIKEFIKSVDVPTENRRFEKFEFLNLSAKEGIGLLPKTLLYGEIILIPNTNVFVTQVTDESYKKLKEFVSVIDGKETAHPIKLKYIKSEELLKNLPPSVSEENIFITIDPSKIFFLGSEELYNSFISELNEIDKPQQQIKYQILVIQRQKTNGLNWSSMFKEESTEETPGITHSSLLSNIFNINFDIVAEFGIQFAASLNAELSEGKSKVLADTTLNGISGETITFSNTNTYRYRDIIADKEGDVYTSTTREIASGLTLSINGWVSGEDMITVKVDAQVSKQGVTESKSSKDITNPPATSEKKVNTNIRTKSGEPIIIGGLVQQEVDIVEKRVPLLGAIPFLGNLFKSKTTAFADTEFIIYLIPFVEKSELEVNDTGRNIERYFLKYVNKNGGDK